MMLHRTRRPVLRHLRAEDLLNLSHDAFLAAWREIIGQPPAVMLGRREMVEALLATWPPPKAMSGPHPAWAATSPGEARPAAAGVAAGPPLADAA